ncbi:MAG: adenylate kinase [Oligoflexia bacterium]|nr:adenylate kinase [Oligoflexia bacterium]
MNIVLFGPPGAGKGTQSALLSKHYNLHHVSTGDLLRNAMKANTSLGIEAKKFVDKGALVPDSVVTGLIKEELQKGIGVGMLLDGFPRNPSQAQALDELLNAEGKNVDQAIFLEVDKSELLNRLTGRRVCSSCGATYHVKLKPTKTEGRCDLCGEKVVQRPDDQESVISNRLEVYDQSTSPLKEYFSKQGKFVAVKGSGDPKDVFRAICSAVDSR